MFTIFNFLSSSSVRFGCDVIFIFPLCAAPYNADIFLQVLSVYAFASLTDTALLSLTTPLLSVPLTLAVIRHTEKMVCAL